MIPANTASSIKRKESYPVPVGKSHLEVNREGYERPEWRNITRDMEFQAAVGWQIPVFASVGVER